MQRSSGSMSAKRHRTTKFHKHVPVSEAAKRAVNDVMMTFARMRGLRVRTEFYTSIRAVFAKQVRMPQKKKKRVRYPARRSSPLRVPRM